MKNLIILTVSIFILNAPAFAQLTVSNGHTAQELADIFTGQSVNAQNCEIVQGENVQYGSFSFEGEGLDVSSGVILSTGNIFDAVGPNTNTATSTGFGGDGNVLFDLLPINYGPNETWDAVLFQFDFQVLSDSIEFEYIFLSEEYNEILGDPEYNDAFAFFISGPGIDGEKNLAVVPGQTIPVTANTINNNSYWQFFHDNEDGNTNIEFDGFTTLMKAKTDGLIPCETYTLKLIIADGGDDYYDSGVLLKESSLSQSVVTVSTETYGGSNTAIESCINANFIFELDQARTEDVEININIEGTAVNGVDYKYIDPVVTIPAGQTQATLIIDAVNDGLQEGIESIHIIYTPVPCQAPDTAKLFIDDYEQIIFTADGIDATCNNASDGEINIQIEGGFSPYTFYVTDTLTLEEQIFTELPITGLDSGTYKLDVIDSYGCKAEDLVMSGEFNAGQTFLPDGNGDSYESVIEISGFQEGQLLESGEQIIGITAVMEHSCAMDLTIVLEAPNGSQVMLLEGGNKNKSIGYADLGEPVASGIYDQWNNDNITPGIGYEYTWNHNPVFGTMRDELLSYNLPYHTYVSTWGNTLSDYYFYAGSYTPSNDFNTFTGTELNGEWKIVVTDDYPQDNGYIFSWNLSIKAERPDSIIDISHPPSPVVSANKVNPDCQQNNGYIYTTISGGNPPFSYLWSNGSSQQNLFNVPSGEYIFYISDNNNCTYDFFFTLSDDEAALLSADILHETCFEASDGNIDLTVSGTEPITYLWDTGSSNQDITDLAAGDYTVTVTDGNDCNAVETYIVEPAPEINLTSEIIDENCGDHEGAINISVAGGVQPYTFLWSNGETTEDIDELEQGDYTVTITDQNGCTKEESFHITNYTGNCIPDCDIEITNVDITDEYCGDSNGTIDLTIFTSYSPYSVLWSNGATTDDISLLTEGEYTITITDEEGCELIHTYNIENQSGDFEISTYQTTEETCGDGTGSIDITINGGAGPYSYLWSNAATTEDISNLIAGEYTVTVTDANICSVSETITVTNNSGDLEQTWGTAVNEVCGNSEGSIDIIINGGLKPYNFNWSNSATTEDLINISEGTYFCTVTDDVGCLIITETYNIENEPGTLNIDDIDVDNEICTNGLGEIELVISGGTEPYSFNWSNGATTQDILNLSAGIYSATINDDNGCYVNTGELTIINSPGTMELSDIIVTDEVCDNNSGEIDITVFGGTEPYTYNWSNGNTAEDLTGLNEGNYSCYITDNNGCDLNINTTVNNDQGTLNVDNIIATDEDCGQSNGAIDLQISGGNAPVNYNWSNGATTQDLTAIPDGNYTCIITDNTACSANANAEVANNSGTLSLNAHALINETCGSSDGSIDITVSGDETPITFLWSNGATSEDISGISAGEYSCIVTDNLGCIIIAGPYTINDFASTLSVENIDAVNEICNDAQGSIDLTISGGTEPINYNWSNGATTEDISNLSAGIYLYIITDNENCSVSGDIEILNDAGTLNLDSYNKTDESCNSGNGAIDITVSGGTEPYNLLWNTGHETEDIDNLSEGMYQVTITDDNNCQIISGEINIINNNGDINISEVNLTNENCGWSNGAVDITVENGTLPYSFLWSTGDDTEDIENLSEGDYSVIITDLIGCSITENFYIENSSGNFIFSDVNITNENCGSGTGTIDITISGGIQPYTYLWSTGETTQDINNLSAGTYSCIVNDNFACSITEIFIVNNTTNGLEVSVASFADDYCHNHNGSIDLNISGGTEPYAINWSNGASSEHIENLWAGEYSVVVTDNTNCSTSQTFFINNSLNENLGIKNIQLTDDECGQNIGLIEFEPEMPGEYIYKINDIINPSGNPVFENISKGNYEISIHDAGCFVKENVYLDNSADFVIDTVEIYYVNCDYLGAIYLEMVPESNHYIYEWSNGSTEPFLENLPLGIYTCIVTDTLTGCKQTGIFEIDYYTNVYDIVASDITNETCGNTNGIIDIHVINPYNTYTYEWDTGETTNKIENLSAGTYSCTITTDYKDCDITAVFEVFNIPGDMEITSYLQDDFCDNSNGYIELTVRNAENGYSVLWNNGATVNDIYNLQDGIYDVEIINNDNLCKYYNSFNIETGMFEIIEDITNSSCENCDDGSIDITLNPKGLYNSFDWSNGATTEDIENLFPGEYSLTVTNQHFCSESETYIVSVGNNINEINNNTNIFIYPNPVNDILNIKYDFSKKEEMKISIYDYLGKKIHSEKSFGTKGVKEINTATLDAGLYILEIITNKKSRIFKFLKSTKF